MTFLVLSWDATSPVDEADRAVDDALAAAGADPGGIERVQRRVALVRRARVNDLVRELTRAVDTTPALVRFWVMRCPDGSWCTTRPHASTDMGRAREIVKGGGFPREV